MPAIEAQVVAPRGRPGIVIILVMALFPLAFTVAGVFLLLHAGPRLIEGLSARNWAEVPGRVIASEVAEVDMGGSGPGTKRWFEVHVTYVFEAAGRTRRGERVGLWPERWLAPRAKEVAAGYPPGHALQVYYKPSDPTRSMLDRSIGGGTWAMACAGVPLLLLGLAMLVGFTRAVRPRALNNEHA